MAEVQIDIQENDILQRSPELLAQLLRDHTTGRNIFWATHDYEHLGKGYSCSDEILPELITGEHGEIIMPRVLKSKEQQTDRSKDMAEVFTPSWICNAQNNLVDEAWFGRMDVFNTENEQQHTWETNPVKVEFPEDKTWKDYVKENRMEMACGEAPYLTSRYDTTTGDHIAIQQRMGILDRKLRIVNENTPDIHNGMDAKQRKNVHKIWKRAAYRALQSVYGFEWQGDSLLLAREALLFTYIDNYQEKFHTKGEPQLNSLLVVADIISWNLWQMDGTRYGLPGYQPKEQLDNYIFQEETPPMERYCRIMDWSGIEPIRGKEIIFKTLLNNK